MRSWRVRLANGHINLMTAGLVGAFMTSLYTFRMIFIVFHGEAKPKPMPVKALLTTCR
jgi:NADH-quinone oxidoreductase subunit L